MDCMHNNPACGNQGQGACSQRHLSADQLPSITVRSDQLSSTQRASRLPNSPMHPHVLMHHGISSRWVLNIKHLPKEPLGTRTQCKQSKLGTSSTGSSLLPWPLHIRYILDQVPCMVLRPAILGTLVSLHASTAVMSFPPPMPVHIRISTCKLPSSLSMLGSLEAPKQCELRRISALRTLPPMPTKTSPLAHQQPSPSRAHCPTMPGSL